MNVSYRTVRTSMIQPMATPSREVECMRSRIQQVEPHLVLMTLW